VQQPHQLKATGWTTTPDHLRNEKPASPSWETLCLNETNRSSYRKLPYLW